MTIIQNLNLHLWFTTWLRVVTSTKRLHGSSRPTCQTIQARVVYAEHCARRGALSKANQTVTTNCMPNGDLCNIDLLRAKHPEPAHPDRDAVS